MPRINRFSPGALPDDCADLLPRFGLSVANLLTSDRQNAKLNKGRAVARSVILHHPPARWLSLAITPDNPHPTAARAFNPGLLELAEREGLTAAIHAHNGCPWATAGCGGAGGGCLAFAGHGGMGQTVSAARGRRLMAYLKSPGIYGRAVFYSLLRHLLTARRDNLPLSARLRGTDDLPWHRHAVEISSSEAVAIRDRYGVDVEPGVATMATRLNAIPDVRHYEYSKAPVTGPLGLIAQRDPGTDITASFAADRPTAVRDALAALAAGFRLAVPVNLPKCSPLPQALRLTAGGQTVIVATSDGDLSDHRWMDPQGPDRLAVLLRTKRSRGADPAVADAFSLAAHGLPQHLADGTVQLIWPD